METNEKSLLEKIRPEIGARGRGYRLQLFEV
jgi:hypothetical protein